MREFSPIFTITKALTDPRTKIHPARPHYNDAAEWLRQHRNIPDFAELFWLGNVLDFTNVVEDATVLDSFIDIPPFDCMLCEFKIDDCFHGVLVRKVADGHYKSTLLVMVEGHDVICVTESRGILIDTNGVEEPLVLGPSEHEGEVMGSHLHAILLPFMVSGICRAGSGRFASDVCGGLRKSTEGRNRGRVRYKVLELKFGERAFRRDIHQAVHVERSMHIVRGHRKDYTNGRGLFGRLSGTWRFGPFIRGTSDAGIINKDYNVSGRTACPPSCQ